MSEMGFVPTMGALHAGHAALISAARKRSEKVIVSVFVNPLQFNDPEDLKKYPRTPEADREIALRAGATEVWFPTYEEIYPADPVMIEAVGIDQHLILFDIAALRIDFRHAGYAAQQRSHHPVLHFPALLQFGLG